MTDCLSDSRMHRACLPDSIGSRVDGAAISADVLVKVAQAFGDFGQAFGPVRGLGRLPTPS